MEAVENARHCEVPEDHQVDYPKTGNHQDRASRNDISTAQIPRVDDVDTSTPVACTNDKDPPQHQQQHECMNDTINGILNESYSSECTQSAIDVGYQPPKAEATSSDTLSIPNSECLESTSGNPASALLNDPRNEYASSSFTTAVVVALSNAHQTNDIGTDLKWPNHFPLG